MKNILIMEIIMGPTEINNSYGSEKLITHKQKVIFSDVIGVTWQDFRTENKTRQQLEEAGFEVLDVIYDSQGIFPTIVARKP